jgi:hypothetical protein
MRKRLGTWLRRGELKGRDRGPDFAAGCWALGRWPEGRWPLASDLWTPLTVELERMEAGFAIAGEAQPGRTAEPLLTRDRPCGLGTSMGVLSADIFIQVTCISLNRLAQWLHQPHGHSGQILVPLIG